MKERFKRQLQPQQSTLTLAWGPCLLIGICALMGCKDSPEIKHAMESTKHKTFLKSKLKAYYIHCIEHKKASGKKPDKKQANNQGCLRVKDQIHIYKAKGIFLSKTKLSTPDEQNKRQTDINHTVMQLVFDSSLTLPERLAAVDLLSNRGVTSTSAVDALNAQVIQAIKKNAHPNLLEALLPKLISLNQQTQRKKDLVNIIKTINAHSNTLNALTPKLVEMLPHTMPAHDLRYMSHLGLSKDVNISSAMTRGVVDALLAREAFNTPPAYKRVACKMLEMQLNTEHVTITTSTFELLSACFNPYESTTQVANAMRTRIKQQKKLPSFYPQLPGIYCKKYSKALVTPAKRLTQNSSPTWRSYADEQVGPKTASCKAIQKLTLELLNSDKLNQRDKKRLITLLSKHWPTKAFAQTLANLKTKNPSTHALIQQMMPMVLGNVAKHQAKPQGQHVIKQGEAMTEWIDYYR